MLLIVGKGLPKLREKVRRAHILFYPELAPFCFVLSFENCKRKTILYIREGKNLAIQKQQGSNLTTL